MATVDLVSDQPGIGAAVRLHGRLVLTGSCSWADRTLVQDGDWYPSRSMSAEQRLRFYAAQFPLAEIDSTYYAPPSEQQARLWAERTPDGFRFDVKAYSLLTGHPTRPQSLWRDLREQLPADLLQKRNVYAHHLTPEALEEAWRRFGAALRPLHDAGRLGAVLFQAPPWFTPRRDNRAELESLRRRLPDYRISSSFARRAGCRGSAIASGHWRCLRSTGSCSCLSTRPQARGCRACWRSPTRSWRWSASTAARTAPGPPTRRPRPSGSATCTQSTS